MALSISLSEGPEFSLRSAAAAMMWPDWQYPHWGTSSAIQASCTALPAFSLPTASMVVIFLPEASFTGTWQDLSALPLMWTVQAPH